MMPYSKRRRSSVATKRKRAKQERERRARKRLALSQSSVSSCDVNSVNIVSPAPSDNSLSSETSSVSSFDDCQLPDDLPAILRGCRNVCNNGYQIVSI